MGPPPFHIFYLTQKPDTQRPQQGPTRWPRAPLPASFCPAAPGLPIAALRFVGVLAQTESPGSPGGRCRSCRVLIAAPSAVDTEKHMLRMIPRTVPSDFFSPNVGCGTCAVHQLPEFVRAISRPRFARISRINLLDHLYLHPPAPSESNPRCIPLSSGRRGGPCILSRGF